MKNQFLHDLLYYKSQTPTWLWWIAPPAFTMLYNWIKQKMKPDISLDEMFRDQ